MRKILGAILLLSLFTAGNSFAAELSQSGRISNVVSRPDGLLIELDNGIPTRCSGTIGEWMIIPEANKSMIAVALMNLESNKLIEVYTDGTFLNGVCKATMFYLQGGN